MHCPQGGQALSGGRHGMRPSPHEHDVQLLGLKKQTGIVSELETLVDCYPQNLTARFGNDVERARHR